MAYIERLQIEAEGFLGGLDVHFDPGLNVIIGARGTGKTSIIELIRFCLGAPSFTVKAGEVGDQHARGVLEGGAVSITLREGDATIVVTRSGDSARGAQEFSHRVTVLGQGEIEAVGAQATGRLRLIDRYRSDHAEINTKILDIKTELVSLSSQIAEVLQEIELLEDQRQIANPSDSEVEAARLELEQLTASGSVSEDQRDQLERLQRAAQILGLRESVTSDAIERTSRLANVLQAISRSTDLALPVWPEGNGEDPLSSAREIALGIHSDVASAGQKAHLLAASLQAAADENSTRREAVDERSRSLRQALDLVQEGIGVASRKMAALEQRLGQVAAIDARLEDRQAALRALSETRDASFDRLDSTRSLVSEERAAVAQDLTRALAPNIRVKVTKSSSVAAYESAIVTALRGSGLRYNTLGPNLARTVSPIELAKWSEEGDAISLAAAASIAVERAAAVISQLKSSGTGELVAVDVDDEVELALLDGLDFKSTDRLSIGQRCTTVLPLLLGNRGDTLVLDQPEDHLDNAFIASTLVKSLQKRSGGQYIFASHNANIPVLGGADRVIVMDSDGEKGFVTVQNDLDDESIVSAISNLMEGGAEAFDIRAGFYASRL